MLTPTVLRVLLLAMAMVPAASVWVFSNDVLLSRIMGERTHSSELESFERLGSGRGGMAIATMEIYAEANFIEKIIGMGITVQTRRMGEKQGSELIPHNGFLGLLTHNGLLGVSLFFWFLFALWKTIGRLRTSRDITFLRALFLAYFFMTFFQSYDILYMPALMMLAYAWKQSSNVKPE